MQACTLFNLLAKIQKGFSCYYLEHKPPPDYFALLRVPFE
jgi:hypothetical protein